MTEPGAKPDEITPELLLRAYAAGIFPMAQTRGAGSVFWVDPRMRGVLPLDGFHIPRRLRKLVRKKPFAIRCNTAFERVIAACAEPRPGHPDTWINDQIRRAYTQLHHMGFVHSVECWLEDELVGGLYGVALGGAFFGESMFSRRTNASKVALVHLLARLRLGGYVLLDVQFVTEHLRQFGVIEIPARHYLERLETALKVRAQFPAWMSEADSDSAVESLLRQSSTQTS
ncbi:MAG: leucyl/phenylalanyl-tRNA--protein transferase [Rhodospirillales bacterium]|nr:leucyl/phenylalanyl-tRNA--protein transferase [Rhodospirillales bacterium]